MMLYEKLSYKLVATLLLFFLVALGAIGMTLWKAWQFEGGAAAINDAGSGRMRSYRLAFLLSEGVRSGQDKAQLRKDIQREVASFEHTLLVLETGDPARPLFLPKKEQVSEQMHMLRHRWQEQIKPMVNDILEQADAVQQQKLLADYRMVVEGFVAEVNQLVGMIERDNSLNTAMLRSYQLGLVALAVIGTVVLLLLMFLLIIRPLVTLQDGIRRMSSGDLGVRLPVETRDEFGQLTAGFNQMADHLEGLYNTLEQRVQAKTLSLEEKNQQLATLYEVTAFLNESASIDELYHGFLKRLMGVLGAEGGSVRLVDQRSQKIHMVAREGLSEEFLRDESCLNMGECLCGDAASTGKPVYWNFGQPTDKPLLYNCRRDGFQVTSAFTIRVKRHLIGIFNLYFREQKKFSSQETQLLETLGQHLGVAIENQRLVSREKEMAISEERNLLAQELHDSIAQSLAFLNIQAQMLQDSLKRDNVAEAMSGLSQMREGIQESYDDVRELLVHFRTRVHHADLDGAIRSSLEKFEGQTGIDTTFSQSGSAAPLAPEYEIQVLHIVQEALSNVRKHAGATRVDVEIKRNGSHVIIIRDNGKGFDPNDLRDKTETHIGLKIMRERAHRIGGQLEVITEPGQGTEVRLKLPTLQREAA